MVAVLPSVGIKRPQATSSPGTLGTLQARNPTPPGRRDGSNARRDELRHRACRRDRGSPAGAERPGYRVPAAAGRSPAERQNRIRWAFCVPAQAMRKRLVPGAPTMAPAVLAAYTPLTRRPPSWPGQASQEQGKRKARAPEDRRRQHGPQAAHQIDLKIKPWVVETADRIGPVGDRIGKYEAVHAMAPARSIWHQPAVPRRSRAGQTAPPAIPRPSPIRKTARISKRCTWSRADHQRQQTRPNDFSAQSRHSRESQWPRTLPQNPEHGDLQLGW